MPFSQNVELRADLRQSGYGNPKSLPDVNLIRSNNDQKHRDCQRAEVEILHRFISLHYPEKGRKTFSHITLE